MFLRRLRFSNFRCFEDLELDFGLDSTQNRQWTVLLGENGTGKSNLLRGIALLTAGSDALAELLGEPEQWIRSGQDHCRLEGVLTTKEGSERQVALDIRSGDSRTDILVRNQEGLARLDRAIAKARRNYFVVGYGTSRRLSERRTLLSVTSRFEDGRAQGVATLFDTDAQLNPLAAWVMDLDYRKSEGAQGLEIARDVLDEFLLGSRSEGRGAGDLRGIRFHSVDKEGRRLLFETPDGILPLSALSDGYQTMAAWVGDLLYRITDTFEDYQYPLHTRGVLMLDEIGLHLHPRWQRLLMRFMSERLPNLQFIVTTHSPLTAQQAGEGELFYFRRQAGRVGVESFHGSPRRLLLHQLLTTDAFGLDTEESLEVATQKARYRELRDMPDPTSDQLEELGRLEQTLRELPKAGPAAATLASDYLDVLQNIEEKLAGVRR